MEILAVSAGATRSALTAVAFVLLALTGRSARADALEPAVKAAFVSKFAPFVEWPAKAFGAADAPFVICVQGEDEVADLIERAAKGNTAWARAIVTRRIQIVSDETGCHIAYLAGSQSQSIRSALAALRKAPVLTVTDGAARDEHAGMIDFVLVAGRVSFDIDEQQAAESGLSISSKLLSLARNVNRR
jgi:hypothetical protein